MIATMIAATDALVHHCTSSRLSTSTSLSGEDDVVSFECVELGFQLFCLLSARESQNRIDRKVLLYGLLATTSSSIRFVARLLRQQVLEFNVREEQGTREKSARVEWRAL